MPLLALIPALINLVPSLVTVFAGDKSGASVQKAIDVVKSVLPGVDLSSPEAFESALTQADPKAMADLKAKLAQFSHEEVMARIDADKAEQERQHQEVLAALDGVKDARARDTAIHQNGGRNDRANWMIASDAIGLIVCLLVLVYVPDLPGEVRGIVSTIAGFFGLGLRDAHQFEFGSSRGSEQKTALLAASTPAAK